MLEATTTYLKNRYSSHKNFKLSDFRHISDGWESEMYACQVTHGPWYAQQRENLVLRLYPGEGAAEKSAREFHAMQQLHQMGYPVPQVFDHGVDHAPFGKPFMIMEFVDGRPLWSILSSASEKESLDWISLFNRLFVQLHQLDAGAFRQPAVDRPYQFVDAWFSNAYEMLPHHPGAEIFLEVIQWLQLQRDKLPCETPSPIHHDFHPNNILIRKDGSGIVIDWTNFEISDRRMDVAWTLVLANAYEGGEVRELFLQDYQQQAGFDLEHIEIFEVFACVRRLFSILSSLGSGAESMGMRPEAVEMMKSQMGAHQRVYNMLIERTGIRILALEEMFK